MGIPPITFEENLRQTCPAARLGCALVAVNVAPSGPELLHFIQKELEQVHGKMALEEIHSLAPLHSAREAYKALGKDPSRYRPSAEALLRRVVQGKGLYQVSNVVDCLNLVSVQTGFSIGGYDFNNIQGSVRFGRGGVGEPYEAIGRGLLNIEGLPVLRDGAGAFGSPTSDSQRTMVTPQTAHFLFVFFDFGGNEGLEKAMAGLEYLLATFAGGSLVGQEIIAQ
jgi:DNA/RNA-binding domain of Phe-tRNA-synthetase-like protein